MVIKRPRRNSINRITMDYNSIPNIDESDVSRDVSLSLSLSNHHLGDSQRSGTGFPLEGGYAPWNASPSAELLASQQFNIQEEKIMEEDGESGSRSRSGSNSSGGEVNNTSDSGGENSSNEVTPGAPQHENVGASIRNAIPPPPLGSNPISPNTPAEPIPPVGNIGVMHSPAGIDAAPSPGSTAALAELYQSSRRSNTGSSHNKSPVANLPDTKLHPPPLCNDNTAGGDKGEESNTACSSLRESIQLGDISSTPTGCTSSVPHVSLQSSGTASTGHESWNTSMSSLMNSSSYLNASSLVNSQASTVPMGTLPSRKPTGERPILANKFRLSGFMDYKIESASDESRRSSMESDESLQHRYGHFAKGGRKHHDYKMEMNYKMEDDDAVEEEEEGDNEVQLKSPPSSPKRREMPTIPNLSGDSSSRDIYDNTPTMDNTTIPEEPPSPSIGGGMAQLSLLSISPNSNKRRSIDMSDVRPLEKIKLPSAMKDLAAVGGEKKIEGKKSWINESSDDSPPAPNQNQDVVKGEGPPKKKNKLFWARSDSVDDEEHHSSSFRSSSLSCQTPLTYKSARSSASFDIIANEPSSRVSSLYDPEDADALIDMDVAELLKGSNDDVTSDKLAEMVGSESGVRIKQEEDEEEPKEAAHQDPQAAPQKKKDHQRREVTQSENEQRIFRRKVQRLLLIRHCSTCTIPPPSLVEIPAPPFSSPDPPGHNAISRLSRKTSKDKDQDRNVIPLSLTTCPATSHCAEGKALCAHIRICTLSDCTYKKCLTSREVLTHFKNCRAVTCQICGPVRSLDQRQRHNSLLGSQQQSTRRKSDSSIETIDDDGWLNANMMP